MIISFDVENFGSFNGRQTVSFVATRLKDFEGGIIDVEAISARRLLPTLLVYGANAAGKSNLVRALEAMIATILFSQTGRYPGNRLPARRPFLLDPAAIERPTTFEINFILEGIRFNYGFSFLEKEISEEWLYSYPLAMPRKLYEREGMSFTFGRMLKGENVAISRLTRPDSLFLSAAAQSGHQELSRISHYFDSIQIETSLSMSSARAQRRIKDEHNWFINEEVIKYLKDIRSGITGYRIKERNVSAEEREISQKIGLAVESVLKEQDVNFQFPMDDETEKVIELEHCGSEGRRVHFPIHLESAGTLRLLAALPKILGVLATGSFVVIDELDLSLHTHAAAKLLRLFCSRKTNPHGAQILATTHDTNLLQSECLRRDQVWFAEKDEAGSTGIFPLTDISTRKADDIERGYLQGRYGASPL